MRFVKLQPLLRAHVSGGEGGSPLTHRHRNQASLAYDAGGKRPSYREPLPNSASEVVETGQLAAIPLRQKTRRLLFFKIDGCSVRLRPDQHAARGHVCCSSEGCACNRPVKCNFDRTHWKLVLAGKGQSVLGDNSRGDRDLDTSTLRVRKDKSPGDCVAILVQRQLRRSLPLVFSTWAARLN